MLDYEIEKYVVEYLRENGIASSTTSFYNEEDALKFITESRSKWEEYRLIKISHAVGEF